jgi:hypothetical protein
MPGIHMRLVSNGLGCFRSSIAIWNLTYDIVPRKIVEVDYLGYDLDRVAVT